MHMAVLTADLVSSRHLLPARIEEITAQTAKDIERRLFRRKRTFELYRGDSIQAVLDPQQALRVALLWRSAIRAVDEGKGGWDIRIAIGIGEASYTGSRVSTSAGQAFELSGLLLDELKKKDSPRIGIRSASSSWNDQLETECILADTIMQRWTPGGAAAVFNALLYEETQEQLASRMGIAQSSIHKRLNSANWLALRHWLQYFQQQVLSYLETTNKS